MTIETTAGPRFGIDLDRYADLVTAVSPHVPEQPLSEHAISERFARAAWSHLSEPGDATAGLVVLALGASTALTAITERWTALQLFQAIHECVGDGVSLEELHTGINRWTPRLNVDPILAALATGARLGAHLVIPADPQWPAGLSDLGDHAPIALWARGNVSMLASLEKSIALVGARAATGYGEHSTMENAGTLARRGFTVISGAAYGIDGNAHRAALASGGATVAVLAGGIDRPYPAGHSNLIDRIVTDGLVISEVPPHTAPTRWRFVQRARIIAAIARATVVVEAGPRSGALTTAHNARLLGRPVGAVPGPITSAASAGCHRLIQEHSATLVTSADDMAALITEN